MEDERERGETQARAPASTRSLSLSLSTQVLDPLRLACASGDARVLAPALGCLHKLVSHAYVQAESSPAGGLDDGTPVAALVSAASAAAASAAAAADPRLQLSALRALLTAATADHFVPHGDALLACVRPAFRLGVAGAGPDVRAAARGALLQTVAAVLKRVADEPGRPLSSREASSVGGGGGGGGSLAGDGGHLFGGGGGGGPSSAGDLAGVAAVAATAAAAPSPSSSSPRAADADAGPAAPATQPDLDAAMGTARAAQLASLAESADLGGLERALDALAADREKAGGGGRAGNSAEGGPPAVPPAPAPTAPAPTTTAPAPWRPPTRLTLAEKDAATLLAAIARIGAGPESPPTAGKDGGPAPAPPPSDPAIAASRALALDLLIRALSGPGHGWDTARRPLCEGLRRPLTVTLLKCAATPPGDPSGAALLGPALLAAAAGRPAVRAVLKAELGAFIPLLLLRPVEGLGAGPGDTSLALASLAALRALFADPAALMDLFVNFDCDLGGPNLAERGMRAAARAAGFGGGGSQSAPGGAAADAPPPPPGSPAAAAAAVRAAGAAALAAAAASLEAWAGPLRAEEEEEGREGGEERQAARQRRGPSSASASGRSLARLATLAPAPTPAPAPSSASAALVATKARKHSLESGVAVFNRDPAAGVAALVASGCVPPDPAALASFLRSRPAGAVDPDALGELFGSPDDAHVAVMRCYVGQEVEAVCCSADGTPPPPLDEALRALLARFRLPGEAQKIDRVMEAFAAAYTSACPAGGGGSAFTHPDGAYLLAFALVMLNTDAHHPSAARGLGKGDFVGMCQAPVVAAGTGGASGEGEDGAVPSSSSPTAAPAEEYAPVLPPEQLEAMYDRIVAREIAPPEGSAPGLLGAPGGPGGGGGSGALAGRASPTSAPTPGPARALAAALGLPLGGGGGRAWDKAAGAAHERARALDVARAALAAAGAASAAAASASSTTTPASHLWQPAVHAEHARPALQAGGDALVRGLGGALAAAPDAATAAGPLAGLAALVRTAALLGLDALVEAGVDALAAAAGVVGASAAADEVGAPSPPVLALAGSGRGTRQVAALETLLATAAGPAASGLGGGWLAVARTLSALDGLAGGVGASEAATPRLATTPPPPAAAPQPSPVHALPGGGLTGGPAADRAAATPPPPPPPTTLPISTPAGTLSAFSRLLGRPAAAGPPGPPPPPAVAVWAASPPGRAAAAAVLAAGPRLPGDGALVFVRCLAARGQEELAGPGPPSLWALHAVADAAAAAGGVDAAAAASAAAAAAAGGGSAALTAPSTMLLRAVWSRVWAAAAGHLAAGACHPDAGVSGAATSRLAALVDALLARRPPASPAAQEQALRPLVAIARGGARPDARAAAVGAAGRALALHGRALALPAWRAALAALAAGAADPAPGGGVVAAALDGVGPALEAVRGVSHGGGREGVRGVVAVLAAAMRNPHPPGDAPAISAAFSLQAVVRCLTEGGCGGEGGDPPAGPASPSPWDEVWAAFAAVARHDPRPPVADAALAAALEVAAATAPAWPPAAWRGFGGGIIRYALDLPCRPGWEGVGLAEDGTGRGWPTEGEGGAEGEEKVEPSPFFLAPRPVGWSSEGATRLARHLGSAGRAVATLVCAPPSGGPASLGACLGPLLGLALRAGSAPDPRLSGLGGSLLEEALARLASLPQTQGNAASLASAWALALSAAATACRADVGGGLTGGGSLPGAPPPPPPPFLTPPGALPPLELDPAASARIAARATLGAVWAVGRALVRAAEAGGPGAGPPPGVARGLVAELKAALARAAGANAARAAGEVGGRAVPQIPPEDDNPLPVPEDPWAAPPTPALARQEVEAGAALLAALGARAGAGVPGAASDLAAAARGVLREAAAGVGGKATAAAPALPAPGAWVEAVRAPLIVAALAVLGGDGTGGNARPSSSSCLPAVAVAEVAPLAAAGHGGVRAALAALLAARVAPALVTS